MALSNVDDLAAGGARARPPGDSMIRVVAFVAGGPIAMNALKALSASHHLVAIVRGGGSGGMLSVLRERGARLASRLRSRSESVSAWADGAGIPLIVAREGNEEIAAERLERYRPDCGCIATFPRRVGPQLLQASGVACLNLHSSLLPRHRGANPLFWTYHAGDREGGVTVHVATDRLDAGPIVNRARCRIGRGEPVVDLHARLARLGAGRLCEAVASIVEGSARPEPQDEARATAAPRLEPGRSYAELGTWGAEQAWHFLAGMAARYREPFADTEGRRVPYATVEGFEIRPPRHAPGSVVRRGAGWTVWACDGAVFLAPEGDE